MNDEGPASVYSGQLEPFVSPGDVLILISVHGGSGEGNAGAWSQNLLRALGLARERGARTIGLSGFDGGALKRMSDVCIVVPIDSTPQVESFPPRHRAPHLRPPAGAHLGSLKEAIPHGTFHRYRRHRRGPPGGRPRGDLGGDDQPQAGGRGRAGQLRNTGPGDPRLLPGAGKRRGGGRRGRADAGRSRGVRLLGCAHRRQDSDVAGGSRGHPQARTGAGHPRQRHLHDELEPGDDGDDGGSDLRQPVRRPHQRPRGRFRATPSGKPPNSSNGADSRPASSPAACARSGIFPRAFLAGAHIVTTPFKFLPELVHHPRTVETIREFKEAWDEARQKGGLS